MTLSRFRMLLYVAAFTAGVAVTGKLGAQSARASAAAVDFGDVKVCPTNSSVAGCAKTLAAGFQVSAGGTLGATQVVTQGVASLDYSLAGSSCTGAVMEGQTCTVQVTFSPKYPGRRAGAVKITDSGGGLLALTYLGGKGVAPQIAFFQPQHASLVSNSVGEPMSILFDAAGNRYQTDADSNDLSRYPPGCTSASCKQLVFANLGANISASALDGAGNLFLPGDSISEVPAGCTTRSCMVSLPIYASRVLADDLGDLFVVQPNHSYKIPPGCSNQSCAVLVGPSDDEVGVNGIALDNERNLVISGRLAFLARRVCTSCSPRVTACPSTSTLV